MDMVPGAFEEAFTELEEAFTEIKKMITEVPGPVLQYYDPSKPVAVVMQNGQLIAYA